MECITEGCKGVRMGVRTYCRECHNERARELRTTRRRGLSVVMKDIDPKWLSRNYNG